MENQIIKKPSDFLKSNINLLNKIIERNNRIREQYTGLDDTVSINIVVKCEQSICDLEIAITEYKEAISILEYLNL